MRAAAETYTRNEASLRRVAQRYSMCADDAEEALQRGLEILLRKGPAADPSEMIRWIQTVVKHEALAVRRERERILSGPAAAKPRPNREDWVALIPASSDGPAEQTLRREEIARGREALRALKPQELRALTLLAGGYSYVEIGEITGYSHTKVNRCLAEGRARFRGVLAGSEDGSRCAEMGPRISVFCDGEAGARETATVKDHLRACAHCRATLRAYRAAPLAASALVPALPLHRALFERAHDALAGLATRLAGGPSDPAQQVASGGGPRGAGSAALAKAAAVCVATVGGAACLAGGVVPVPEIGGGQANRMEAESRAPAPVSESTVEHEPAPPPRAEPERPAEPAPSGQPPTVPSGDAPEYAPPAVETVPLPAPVETPPPTPPVESPAPVAAGEGSAAGEFGP